MNKVILSLLVLVFSQTVLAGKIVDSPEMPGVNENVLIEFDDQLGTWGFSGEIRRGHATGTGQYQLIPVTAEAFEVLADLERGYRYACTLKMATLVLEKPIDANYYVIEIDCD